MNDSAKPTHPVIPGLNLIWMDEFLANPDKPVDWFWDGLIAQGNMVILAADAKAGKTTLLLPLIVSALNGTPFLGRQVRKCKVLLASEDPKEITQAALIKLGLTVDNADLIIMPEFQLPLHYQKLEQAVQMLDVGLVVVDTLSRFMRLEDENNNSEVEGKMRKLSVLSHKYNFTVILGHHSSAAGRPVRGATALLAIPDVIIGLQKTKGLNTRQRVLTFDGRNVGAGPNKIICESTGDPRWSKKGVSYWYESVSEVSDYVLEEDADAEARLLKFIDRQTVPLTKKEIKKFVPMKNEYLVNALDALEAAHSVLVTGTGKSSDPKKYGSLKRFFEDMSVPGSGNKH